MIREFEPLCLEITESVGIWVPKLSELSADIITGRRNIQNRTIKQILGHMVDSASNNTHRIVHLQYRENPLVFPNYATEGNNDRWIAIQNYQEEDWKNLVQLWKYAHLHIVHVIRNVNHEKLKNEWIPGPSAKNISLRAIILDFPVHFRLHLSEMDELIRKY